MQPFDRPKRGAVVQPDIIHRERCIGRPGEVAELHPIGADVPEYDRSRFNSVLACGYDGLIMIINHPVLNRFAPSIREAVPQINDDKLIIPNTLQLVGLPPEPVFRALPGSSNTQESSFTTEQNATVANAAAVSLNFGILRNGLWSLNIFVGYRANFVGSTQAGDVKLSMDLGTGNVQLLTLYASVASQSAFREIELMLIQNTTLTFTLGANSVGQEHMCNIHVIANKLL